MTLYHPDYEAEKHLYIYIGELVLACAFWQKPSHGKKELIEYWSKAWMNKVADYSEEEKFALATREAIKCHAALMQVASQTYIYTSSHSFTTIATHLEMRTSRSTHYLINAMTYRITFFTKPTNEFSLLNEQLPDVKLLTHISTVAMIPLARYFRTTAADVATIPMVWTDKSFMKSIIPGGKSVLGIFWEPDSPFNAFTWAVLSPFTNQRAELEAILHAIQQAKSRHFTRLIINSDSKYAVGLLT